MMLSPVGLSPATGQKAGVMEPELMCVVVALVGLGFVLCVVGVILGGTAMARITALRKRVEGMGRELESLRRGRGEAAVRGR